MALMSSGDDIKRRTSRIPAPLCPVHGAKMLRYSQSEDGRTKYCKCPICGCSRTGKAICKAKSAAEHSEID